MGQDRDAVGFSAYLEAAIEEAGFATPSQFARKVGTDPSTVLRWINGEARPTIRLLERIGPVLGKDINELVAQAYPEATTAPAEQRPVRRSLHPLAAEVDRLLGPDSPLTGDEQQRVTVVVETAVTPYRTKGRRRRAS